MHCHEFEERLQIVLDERRRPELDGKLARHAEQCVDCRGSLAAQQALFAGLGDIPPLQPDFSTGVVRQVADAPLVTVKPPLGLGWAWSAVFAVGAAAACLLWFSPGWNPQEAVPSQTAIQRPARPKAETLAVARSSATARSADGIEGSNQTLTKRDDSGLSPSADVPGPHYEAQVRQWVLHLPDAVDQIEDVDYQLVEEYAPGLRSLRASFSLALETLRRSLPGHRESLKSQGAQMGHRWLAPA
jgi:hypothetical protein